jgi:eukaryotic-like serine/threonine-protein kinase
MTAHDRLTAALADRYRIQREVGAGGMATVYVAHDVRHDRSVAIKILRPELSAAIGADRFLAEIRTTANLQHPNILALFDSGQAGELLYYVMPFIDGDTLRDRLDREKQLPITDAIRIASEVASALDYAHRHGVIHRDIKPSNILFHDGRALVADFGIALAASKGGTDRMTHTGMTLGTPHYMSPEQGMADRNLTPRTDIYSLGAMTYEMLAGEPPFTGPTAQAILAKVLTAEPKPPRELRKSIPPHVEDAVLTALQKLPADRFATAADFATALADGPEVQNSDPARRAHRSAAARPSSRRFTWKDAVLLPIYIVGGGFAWALSHSFDEPKPAQPVRMAFSIGMPGVDRSHVEISSDGRRIIQVVSDSNGVDRVVMRELGSTALKSIQGSEGATDPVFSLDGEWISFNSDGKLRKVPTAGGPPIDIDDSASVGGGAWMPDGNIVFTRDGRGLWTVPSTGGAARQLTSLDATRKEFNHWYPQGLPGGKAVIYTSYATPLSQSRIEAYDFKSKKKKALVSGAVYGRYSASGHLLYARDGAIFAVPFDAKTLAVTGTPIPVEEDVAWVATDGLGGYAISQTGTLAFLKSSEWNVERRVIWTDRAGREVPALPGPGAYAEPRISPDGKWIVITITEPRRELWLYGIGGAALTPLSRTNEAAFNAVWTPDSKSVVYSHENPVYDLHSIPVDGSALDKPIVASKWDKFATSISPDGQSLAYIENNNSDRILIAPMDGSSPPRPLTIGATSQRSSAFSPDGRWMAYEELSHGQPDIFLTAVNGAGGRQKISVAGGEQPRWTKGGRELIYRRGDAVMAAQVDLSTGKSGTPVELFRKTQPDRLGGGRTYTYDVAPDGNRFLLVVPVQHARAQPAVVVLNWFAELNSKLRQAK